jgi:hypothetical protein
MFRRFKRKGYYFIIDAFIGSTIIFMSLLIILNGGVRPTKIQYNYEMTEEYSSFILNTKIEDLSNDYVDQLRYDGNITNTKLTIMEQVDLFYYNNKLTQARELVKNITEPLIPEKYGFSYSIINSTTYDVINKINITDIYNRTSDNGITTDIKDARIVIASKKITFLQINSSTMFGPAMTQIKVWI